MPSSGTSPRGKTSSPTQMHPVMSPQRQSFSGPNSESPFASVNLTHASTPPQSIKPASPLYFDAPENAQPVATTDDSGSAPRLPAPVRTSDSDPNSNSTPTLPYENAQNAQPHAEGTALTALPFESFTAFPPKPSLRDHRTSAHRKNDYSLDTIPRQTIMKALQSRPPPLSMDSIAAALGDSSKSTEDTAEGQPHPHQRATDAFAEMEQSGSMSSKMAALASPCFFHKKFDKAVNIEKVLDEIADDDSISHSRLIQTATSVREVSKLLQRRPIKMTVRNVMIVTKARDNELVHLTRQLAEWLLCTPRYGSDVGVNVYVDHKLRKSKRFDKESLLAKDSRFENMLRFWTPELCWTSPEKFDLVLTLGGDGTVLFTSWLFQRIVPPVLAFALGSLGFLTNFEFAQFKEALNKIMGDAGMRINVRMRFTCTVYRYQKSSTTNAPQHIEAEQFEVLNELVIDRGPSPYVSNLELYGDNSLLTVVQADGCIFSTPTGSTAYSLSAGGALVHPDIPAILLTPICPHTLSFRPMMLNDSMLLRVDVPRNSRATAYCAFDGKGRVELRQGDHVTIAASQYPFPTVLSQPTEWFDSISRTLRWNNRAAQQKAWDGEAKEGDESEADQGFDIDFDNDENDSGYSAEGSTAGGRDSPIRKGVVIPFL